MTYLAIQEPTPKHLQDSVNQVIADAKKEGTSVHILGSPICVIERNDQRGAGFAFVQAVIVNENDQPSVNTDQVEQQSPNKDEHASDEAS